MTYTLNRWNWSVLVICLVTILACNKSSSSAQILAGPPLSFASPYFWPSVPISTLRFQPNSGKIASYDAEQDSVPISRRQQVKTVAYPVWEQLILEDQVNSAADDVDDSFTEDDNQKSFDDPYYYAIAAPAVQRHPIYGPASQNTAGNAPAKFRNAFLDESESTTEKLKETSDVEGPPVPVLRGPPGPPGPPGPKGETGDWSDDVRLRTAFKTMLKEYAHTEEVDLTEVKIRATVERLLKDTPLLRQGPGSTPIKGQKGEPGNPGPPGPTGATGPDGPAGPAGSTGETGPAGPAGEKGEPGTNGTPGTNGNPGSPGSAGTPGANGAAGQKGEPGSTGATGQKGEPGTGAGSKGEPGAKGDQGLPGQKGQKGEHFRPFGKIVRPILNGLGYTWVRYDPTVF